MTCIFIEAILSQSSIWRIETEKRNRMLSAIAACEVDLSSLVVDEQHRHHGTKMLPDDGCLAKKNI